MTAVTAIVALVISLGSLAFSIYQYHILHRIRVDERATSLLRLARDLRRKSEDLKHKIESTDNVNDCSALLAVVNAFAEEVIPKLALSNERTLGELFKMEHHLMSLELEIDLFHKQVVEAGKFNEEVREYEAKKAAGDEL